MIVRDGYVASLKTHLSIPLSLAGSEPPGGEHPLLPGGVPQRKGRQWRSYEWMGVRSGGPAPRGVFTIARWDEVFDFVKAKCAAWAHLQILG